MALQQSEWDKQMMQLDAEIRRLEAEFNMFFAGRLPRPPWETRARVAALVKKHDKSFIRNTADRFRFESLQNRYSKFLELWERQMTNRELGRPMVGGGARAGAAGPHEARKKMRRNRAPRSCASAPNSDPDADSTRVKRVVRADWPTRRKKWASSRLRVERLRPRWSGRRSKNSAPTARRRGVPKSRPRMARCR